MYRVREADKKAIGQYCKELGSGSKKLRANKDVNHKKQGISLALMPTLYYYKTISLVLLNLSCIVLGI
jgi:hypothetical protein